MDLLRLALERSTTASEAVEVITVLLEQHGQGGNCGHITPAYYHNGFMIADASDAFVLETVGREWVCERIRTSVRAISNGYSIGRGAERASAGLDQLIRTSGWSQDVAISYADAIAVPNVEHIAFACERRARSEFLLREREGRIDLSHLFRVLRDHGVDAPEAQWNPWEARARTLCMHAGARERPAQTTGSMASEIHPNRAVHWVTGTSAPCLSLFKPVLLDAPLPSHGPAAAAHFDPKSLWWRHERLHRAAMLGDFSGWLQEVRGERDALESEFQNRIRAVMDGGSSLERAQVVAECWQEAIAVEERWWTRGISASTAADDSYLEGWHSMNELAGVP